jgi:uncharacterized protein (DUF1778 family)
LRGYSRQPIKVKLEHDPKSGNRFSEKDLAFGVLTMFIHRKRDTHNVYTPGVSSEARRSEPIQETNMVAAPIPQEPASSRRDTVINVRVSRTLRELIDRAADVAGKSRSEFILESARAHATDVLLDQSLFTLDEGRYDAFIKALEAPPAPNEKLRQLMASKAPWET